MSRSALTPAARVQHTRATGALSLLAAGLVLALAACGSGQVEPTTTLDPGDAPATTAVTEPEPPVEATEPQSPDAVARIDATEPLTTETAGAPPAAVSVPDLDIDMPVLPVGIAPDGQTEVPADALDAGWYRFGPGAGADRGATVILAHAGSVITPRGPFSRLSGLAGGELIEVTDEAGAEHTYRVVSVEVLEKLTLDLTPYFERDGEPKLVLITCGGQWDESASSYRSNVIVTAVPG